MHAYKTVFPQKVDQDIGCACSMHNICVLRL